MQFTCHDHSYSAFGSKSGHFGPSDGLFRGHKADLGTIGAPKGLTNSCLGAPEKDQSRFWGFLVISWGHRWDILCISGRYHRDILGISFGYLLDALGKYEDNLGISWIYCEYF